jgi:hypothetical protein
MNERLANRILKDLLALRGDLNSVRDSMAALRQEAIVLNMECKAFFSSPERRSSAMIER